MMALGLDLPRMGVDALFDTFDPDGGGSIDYNELYHALKRRVALDPSLRAGSLGSIELKSLNKSSRFTRSASAGAAPLGGKRQRKAWEDVRDPKRRYANPNLSHNLNPNLNMNQVWGFSHPTPTPNPNPGQVGDGQGGECARGGAYLYPYPYP